MGFMIYDIYFEIGLKFCDVMEIYVILKIYDKYVYGMFWRFNS